MGGPNVVRGGSHSGNVAAADLARSGLLDALSSDYVPGSLLLGALRLVDEAGWRGRPFGGAMFSPLHSNFLINSGDASAADIEGLVEAVRADVLGKLGIELHWEIKRLGRALP